MPTYIKNGQTEKIYSLFLDEDNDGITGASPTITIKRVSDGLYYDFNDNTFKASGWTTRQGTLTQVDATNDPGLYTYSFDTSSLDDDDYLIKTDLATATNAPQLSELRVGDWVDEIQEKEVMMNVVYDTTADTLAFETWLELSGQQQITGLSNGRIDVYTAAGVLSFSLTDAAADAQGVFSMTKATPGLSADDSYYCICQIDYNGATIKSNKAFITAD